MIENEQQARDFCLNIAGPEGIARLDRLAVMLKSENGQQNLVSRGSLAMIWQRHMADSLQLLSHVPREMGPWLDLGSGAGFPGLAIAAARPEQDVVLVESRKRRVEWLEQAAAALGLKKCRIMSSRLEDVESFDAGQICARAFAPLEKLLSLSARFSTCETIWLLPKGRSAAQELSNQSKPVRRMFHVEQSVTDTAAGILIGLGVPQR